jgi:predicted DsbA family dithiol-disulfide isomerase
VPGIHFGDAACPPCATTWAIVESGLLQFPTQGGVQLHLLALPSHTWPYALARSIYAVKAISEDIAKELVHGIYVKREQNQLTASTMRNTPESKMTAQILNYIASTYGLDPTKLQASYNSTQRVQNTRIDSKYSYLRHIRGTPTVYVNGAESALTENSALSD